MEDYIYHFEDLVVPFCSCLEAEREREGKGEGEGEGGRDGGRGER